MRNEYTLNALVNELQSNCGDDLAACKAVGVSLLFVNQWRKDDPKVDQVLAEAAHVGTQGLVSAAIQRAVHGWDDDVYYRGVVVGQKKNYSDGLLAKLLEAKREEFRKGNEGGVHVNVNVANVMPRASSYDEWLTMKDRTMKRALPAPDAERDTSLEALGRVMCEPPAEVIDAEYAEIPVNPFKGIEL